MRADDDGQRDGAGTGQELSLWLFSRSFFRNNFSSWSFFCGGFHWCSFFRNRFSSGGFFCRSFYWSCFFSCDFGDSFFNDFWFWCRGSSGFSCDSDIV